MSKRLCPASLIQQPNAPVVSNVHSVTAHGSAIAALCAVMSYVMSPREEVENTLVVEVVVALCE